MKLLLATFALAALTAPTRASVIVVQNGVPNLSTTVTAAAPGDTILVKGGGSGFGITITGKALTVVVDPPGSFQLLSVQVRDLPAGQTCSVSGFSLLNGSTPVDVTNCAGSVRIADTTIVSASTGSVGALVSNCADVSFARCTLRGGDGQNPAFPEVGLMVAAGSNVAVFDSSIRGGRGANATLNMVFSTISAQPGAAAVEVDATSQFFTSASTLTAGDGGNGRSISCHITTCLLPSSGAMGGTALESAPGALSTTIGSTFVPGNGGTGGTGGICCGSGGSLGTAPNGANGAASAGPLTTLMGNAVSAAMPTYARVNQTLPISIVGQPGDEAFLAVSLGGQWLFAPTLGGVLTPGPLLRRIALGTIPGTGVLQTNFAVPELAGVTEAFLIHAQPVTVSPALERPVGPGQTGCW